MAETQKNAQTNKKRAMTGQINPIKQFMVEKEAEKVAQEELVLKRLFQEFAKGSDQYIETLEGEESIEKGDAYFTAVKDYYIKLLTVANAYEADLARDAAKLVHRNRMI